MSGPSLSPSFPSDITPGSPGGVICHKPLIAAHLTMPRRLILLATLPGKKPHVQYLKQYLPLSSLRQSQMPPCFPGKNPYSVGKSCKGGKLNERLHPWCTLPGNMDLKTAPKDSAAQRNYLALGGEIIPDGGGNCNNAKALSDVTNPDQTVAVLVR